MALTRRHVLAAVAVVALAGGTRLWWAHREASEGGVHVIRGVRVKRLLDPRRVAKLGDVGDAFEVTQGGNVIIRADDALVELAFDDDGVSADRLPPADRFALDGHGLLAITGRFFGQLEEDGAFSRAVPLPAEGMRLAPSAMAGQVYLFGGAGDLARRLYALGADGSLRILVDLPEPIVGACDSTRAAYAATASGSIFRIARDGVSLAFRLPDGADAITSIAADPLDRAIYFASVSRVQVLRGTAALALVTDVGGALRWQGTLHVWDARRKLLLRLDGIEAALGFEGAG